MQAPLPPQTKTAPEKKFGQFFFFLGGNQWIWGGGGGAVRNVWAARQGR
jgi:hypothetical protein